MSIPDMKQALAPLSQQRRSPAAALEDASGRRALHDAMRRYGVWPPNRDRFEDISHVAPVGGDRVPASWARCTEADLAIAQLEAIAAWTQGSRSWMQDGERRPLRSQLDRRREVTVCACVTAALAQQVAKSCEGDCGPLHTEVEPRVVVAWQSGWFAERLLEAFLFVGFEVAACVDNGADALGVAIAEQPDLLVLQDALVLLPAEAVTRAAVQLAPRTLAAVGVDEAGRDPALREAGAAAVFPQVLPPAEVAADLVALVETHRAPS